MSDLPGQPWGRCAVFGCPLPGTLSSESQWYCFCHVNRPATLNSAITARLRGRLAPIVETTLDIRRCGASFHESPDLYRAIQKRVVSISRHDLLFGFNGADCSPYHPRVPIVRMWLARLESVLLAACVDSGTARKSDAAVSTAAPEVAMSVEAFVETARQAIASRARVLDIVEREPGSDDE